MATGGGDVDDPLMMLGASGGQFGNVPTIRHHVISDDVDDDEEELDETLIERLWALGEMFPDRIRNATYSLVSNSWLAGSWLLSNGRKAVWLVSSSAMILLLPYLFEKERVEMEQMQRQHERQVLLGPHAAISGMQGSPRPGMFPPMPGLAAAK